MPDPTVEYEDAPSAVPLCLHCLRPYDPLLYYCPACHAAVGQYTPNIPFVNISYQCEFWGRLWQQLWSRQSGRHAVRVLGVVLIVLLQPILLLGLPFILWRRRHPDYRGFDIMQDARQRESPPVPPPLPGDDRPNFSDRPRIPPR